MVIFFAETDFAETMCTDTTFAEAMFAKTSFAETMPILLKLSIILEQMVILLKLIILKNGYISVLLTMSSISLAHTSSHPIPDTILHYQHQV